VRLAVCRAPNDKELAKVIARTLMQREAHNIMRVVALAEAMSEREGPIAAATVYGSRKSQRKW